MQEKNTMDLIIVLASLFVVALPLLALAAVTAKRRDTQQEIQDLESRMKHRNQTIRRMTDERSRQS